MKNITSETEIIDYYVRLATLNPENDIKILDVDGLTYIFSIGGDHALYLTKETDGKKEKFTRTKIFEQVISFDAELMGNSQIALGFISQNTVYAGTVSHFEKLDFNGVLYGKLLTPYRCTIAALKKNITLFTEFHDAAGYTEQFFSIISPDETIKAKYFPLASNFSEVISIAGGQAARQHVDGMYTYGEYGGTTQLLYTPSMNVFGTTPPIPLRLKAETELDAICSLPLNGREGTHLFAAGQGKLYFYPYQEQYDWIQSKDNIDRNGFGQPKKIAESEKFISAKQIEAFIHEGKLYLFIRNGSGNIYYTFAPYDDSKNMPGSFFFEPILLCRDAVEISAKCGRVSICTKNKFLEGTQDKITGAFTFHEIMLPSEIDGCEKFNAYSTKINVYAANAEVNITSCTANKKLAFYSDGTYHKTARFETKSDALGYVTIVQEADNLTPDCFNVYFKEDMLQINPAEQAQKKLLELTSPNDFKDAMIFTPQGQKLPLVENPDQNKLSGAAAGICSIRNSIHSLMPGFISPVSQFIDGVVFRIVDKVISILPASLTDNPFVGFISEVIEDVAGALNWLIGKVKELYDKTIGKAIEFIIQKTEKVWKFFLRIGEKVLHVVLDCAEKVWEAVKNVLELVGIPVDKIFDFLKKALGIDDACRINNALKNMAHMSVNVLTEKTKEISKKSIEAIDSIIGKISAWADLPLELPDKASGKIKETRLNTLPFSLNSHNMYLFDILQSGFNPLDIVMPTVNLTEELKNKALLLADDLGKLKNDITGLGDAASLICEEILGLLHDMELNQFLKCLKRISGTIGIEFLKFSRDILHLLFDFLASSLQLAWNVLSAPIHIPFLSQILSTFGIHEFSIMDVITFPVAFMLNIISKTTELFGKEFLSLEYIDRIAAARSFDDISTQKYEFHPLPVVEMP